MTSQIIYSYGFYRVQKRFLNYSYYAVLGLVSRYSWQTVFSSKILSECQDYQNQIHLDYDNEKKKTKEFQPIIKTSL